MRHRAHSIRIASLGLLALGACSHRGSSVDPGVTHFVATAARGTADGSSWANALGSLQEALMRAQPGDEVWVESGTYRPAAPGEARESTFMLVQGVALRGGFAGTEASMDERDPHTPPSILDGDLNGDDAPGFQNRADNCWHVITAHMVHEALLDTFTVRGGYADGPALGPHVESGDQGSGMTVFHAHPHVMNCTFTDNWALNHGTVNDHGGGMYEDCVFTANYAQALGAGLYFHGDIEAHAHRCRFVGNETPGQGGGAYSRSSLESTFEDCTFFGNRAESGAGMYMAPGSATTLERGWFDGNIAEVGGGGLYIEAATGHVVDSTFLFNSAGEGITSGAGGAGGSGGGGIFANAGAPTIEDCTFDTNSASLGAGVYFNDESTGSVRRCTFLRGHAFEAGGLYTLQSAVTVEDCAFEDNVAEGGTFSVGGGMSVYIAEAQVRRCTFLRNSAQLGGGGLYTEGATPSIDGCRFAGNFTTGSVQGWGGGYMAGYFTAARLVNCAFEGNRATRGGAVFAIAFAEPTLVNATLVGNRAVNDGGGILAFTSSNVRVRNSIVWNNHPEELAGVPPDLGYVCVAGGAPGTGNIGVDPGFVTLPDPGLDGLWATNDDVYGDLRLLPGSPCRDAGDNASLLGDELFDLAGNARFVDDPDTFDTGVGPSPVVDLGAFEASARD